MDAAPSQPHRGRRWLRLVSLVGALVLGALVLARWFGGSATPDHMQQGLALYEGGAYADAAHHFYRHAQSNPGDAEPHLYLGRVHRRLGRVDLAEPALQDAVRLSPREPAAHREMGFLMIETGQLDEAVAHFRTAVSLDEDVPESWLGLVSALRLSGQEQEADRMLRTAPPAVRERFDAGSEPRAPAS